MPHNKMIITEIINLLYINFGFFFSDNVQYIFPSSVIFLGPRSKI